LYDISQDKESMVGDLVDRGKSGVEEAKPRVLVGEGIGLIRRSL